MTTATISPQSVPIMLPGQDPGAGPIAAAAALVTTTIKQKQTSLLTTALGATIGQPIHPFLSANAPAAPGLASSAGGQGDAQLEHVLDSWDRAWMGSDHGGISGTSQSPYGSVSPETTTVGNKFSSQTLTASHASRTISSMPAGRAMQQISQMPPLPTTPPPHHRPLSMATPDTAGQGDAEDVAEIGVHQHSTTDEDDDGSMQRTAVVSEVHDPHANAIPVASHRSQASPLGMAANSSAFAINMQQPAIPKGAKDATDFASVFFSPLPYSYLSLARSDSTDHILVNSVGSPDITLRNGRLTATTSITHVEWPVETSDCLDANANNENGTNGLQEQSELTEHPEPIEPTTKDDVTTHGIKRRKGQLSNGHTSSGALTGEQQPLSLVQQTLAQVRLAEQLSGETENGSTSPLSPTVVDLLGHSLSPSTSTNHPEPHPHPPQPQPITQSQNGSSLHTTSIITNGDSGVTVKVVSAATTTTSTSTAANASVSTSMTCQSVSVSTGPSIIARSISTRAASPPMPSFSSHPAVAALPLPGMPPIDSHLQGTGYMSIASALEPQSPSQSLRLVAAAAMIPHVDKADKGGEDAYCIVTSGLGSIGVADGVSGWAEEGIDPAEYSRTLMRYCSEALQQAGSSADAREVIRYAHKSTVMPGSSTVCLALMKPQGRLQIANLGDSGVRIVRDGRIIFASNAQQHMFNMPFQLSHPSIIDSPDDADSADVTTVDVVAGDVIVMATDGLYDNMFDEEICAICCDVIQRRKRALLLGTGGGDAPPSLEQTAMAATELNAKLYTVSEAEALAVQITRTAHRYAQNPYQRTPWSVASCEQGYGWAKYFAKGGGKMDDCTVIVSFVQPAT